MVVEIQDIDALKKGDFLVDFYTSTCAPCRAMSPFLEELSEEFEFQGVTIAKVEVTKNVAASQMYGIVSVPTLMVLQDSKIKEVTRGFQTKATMTAMLEKHVGKKGH